jgi:hypothetical protein
MKRSLIPFVLGLFLGGGIIGAVAQQQKQADDSPVAKSLLGELEMSTNGLRVSMDKEPEPLKYDAPAEYLKIPKDQGWTRDYLHSSMSRYFNQKADVKSAAQASQVADEASLRLQWLLVAQNARIIDLLENPPTKK